ncbi:sterol desaturase family protein [Psychroserpens algicola]|uniref:Sterol desaturase family protein n=1 Tax=Psychroserpens algicola TaxID=1719034 RepID=A0ABT0H5Z5_9FLAO|nr:sterol desaturase family protein [Psychroserpens algicola]MCK8479781.1 sterol desaturase family protein [Psychroserpens algicola]
MERFNEWLVNDSEDFQFILFFGFLFLFIAIEYFLFFRKLKREKRWKTNFGLTVLAILSMMLIPFTFISAAKLSEINGWGLFNLIDIEWFWLAISTLILRGFISFFTHYLAHKIPLFWRIHRVHHLDTEMDVSTTVRFHPFEFIINSLVGIPIVFLFGFPVWGLMLYELFDIVITLFSHSNTYLPKRINKILQYFIVTPNLHRVHHSSYQPETDSNFSAVFPVWDILFGTFKTKTREPQSKMELGLEEVRDQRTTDMFWILKSPFKNIK